jgi:hypothetical protein
MTFISVELHIIISSIYHYPYYSFFSVGMLHMRYVDEVQEMDDWLKCDLLFSLKVICVMFVNILDLFSHWSVQVLAVVGVFFFLIIMVVYVVITIFLMNLLC